LEEDAERDAERAESQRDAERAADAQERKEEEILTIKNVERADAQEAVAERAVVAADAAAVPAAVPADAVN